MTPADRFKASLVELIERAMRRVRYLGLDVAVVVAQQPDGRLELTPEDTTLPGMVDVPIRHGLPGVTGVAVAAGTRVRVGFDGGDPKRPFAVLWDAGSATSVTFNASTKRLARTDDAVDGGHLLVAAGSVVAYLAPGVPLPDPMPPGQSAIALAGTITGSSMIRG